MSRIIYPGIIARELVELARRLGVEDELRAELEAPEPVGSEETTPEGSHLLDLLRGTAQACMYCKHVARINDRSSRRMCLKTGKRTRLADPCSCGKFSRAETAPRKPPVEEPEAPAARRPDPDGWQQCAQCALWIKPGGYTKWGRCSKTGNPKTRNSFCSCGQYRHVREEQPDPVGR